MLPLDQSSVLAILAAFAANVAIGMFWYSQFFLGKPWMRHMKINPNAKPDGMAQSFAVGLGGSLFGTYMLLWLLNLLPAATVTDGMMSAFLLWLGIVVPLQLNQIAWERRSVQFVLINASHSLVSLLAASAILVRLA